MELPGSPHFELDRSRPTVFSARMIGVAVNSQSKIWRCNLVAPSEPLKAPQPYPSFQGLLQPRHGLPTPRLEVLALPRCSYPWWRGRSGNQRECLETVADIDGVSDNEKTCLRDCPSRRQVQFTGRVVGCCVRFDQSSSKPGTANRLLKTLTVLQSSFPYFATVSV